MYNRIEITSYDSNSHGHNWKKKWFRYDTVLPGKSGKTSPLRSFSEGWINGISKKKNSLTSAMVDSSSISVLGTPWLSPFLLIFWKLPIYPAPWLLRTHRPWRPHAIHLQSQNKFFVKSPSSRCFNLYVWWWWWYLGLWWQTPNLAWFKCQCLSCLLEKSLCLWTRSPICCGLNPNFSWLKH